MLTRCAATVLLAIALAVAGRAQTPEATAAVSGVVIDGTTNAPVEGAMVSLLNDGIARPGEFARRVFTDSQGRFVFTGLAASERLTASAAKHGYLEGGFGTGPGASGGRLVLRNDEWVRDVRIVIWKHGVISGTILDERGEPLVDVYVQAYRRIRLLGHAQYVTGPLARTDDRGRYRFSDLVPGEYVVLVPSTLAHVRPSTGAGNRRVLLTAPDDTRWMASHYPLSPPPSGGTRLSYPPTFFPSARSLDQATTIEIGFADQRPGIDVHLAPVPAFRLAGVIDGPADARANIVVRLFPAGSEVLGPGGLAADAQTTPDGRFTFVGVPAGQYTIDNLPAMTHFVHSGDSSAPYDIGGGAKGFNIHIGPAGLSVRSSYGTDLLQKGLWIRQPITVDRDDDRLRLSMRAPGLLTARIVRDVVPGVPVFELGPSASAKLSPADGSPLLGVRESIERGANASDRFTIADVLPGKYVLTTTNSATAGWIVKSMTWRGRDYTDQPFDFAETPEIRDVEIVVTNSAAEIAGVVRNSDGAPVPNATVLVFPSAPALWNNVGLFPQRIRTAVTAGSGRYVVSRIPAGRYSVVAIEGTVRPDLEVFQASQAVATPVTLSWTDKRSLDLAARKPSR